MLYERCEAKVRKVNSDQKPEPVNHLVAEFNYRLDTKIQYNLSFSKFKAMEQFSLKPYLMQ